MPEPHDHNRDDDLRPDPYLEVSWNGRIKKKRRRKPRRSDPASNPNWVSATDQFMGQNRAPFPQAPDYQSAPAQPHPQQQVQAQPAQQQVPPQQPGAVRPPQGPGGYQPARPRDRKSTRLNSSHVAISYAVFCSKRKKSGPRNV